jgi:hypothetical protein
MNLSKAKELVDEAIVLVDEAAELDE